MSQQVSISTAKTRLAQITRANASVPEAKTASGTVRHKCFLSYHKVDAPEVLEFVESFGDVFIPRSIGVSDDDGDIIDSNDDDYVMDRIRQLYLSDSTVTIVLIGACTWARRYVDWEIQSTLRRDPVNRLSGLMAITLPSMASNPARKLPARLADNVDGAEGYARWKKYPSSAHSLQGFIEEAFQARLSREDLIDNSRARRLRNGSC